MEIDNFKILKGLFLNFVDGEFYFIQILQRKKENIELKGKSRIIKTYYIDNEEDYNYYEAEIKTLCETFNARAYISVNRRSYEKIAFATLSELANVISNKQFESVRNIYNSACGRYITSDKYWIVDIDTKDESYCDKLIDLINNSRSKYEINVVLCIDTINGFHLITRPFDLYNVNSIIKDLNLNLKFDIHKNNPTLLYYKQNDVP